MSQLAKLALPAALRHHLHRSWRYYFITAWIGLILFSVIGLSIWPVTADALIKYFIIVPESKKLVLQWSTQNEYDLSGFEVLCKQETELDNDYHVIGEVQAQGGPQEGANYQFAVNYKDLEPGVSYCFALRDVTVQGRSENLFPRCGYGIRLTPTPVTTTTLTNTIGFNATAVIRSAQATATALYFDANATAAALSAGGVFSGTPTFITTTLGVTATATLTPGLNLTGTVPITATPTPILVETPNFTATQQAIISATLQAANLQLTPTQPQSPLPTPVPPITATQTVTTTTGTTTTSQLPGVPPEGEVAGAGNQVAALPSPLYVAVTQTPTPVTTPIPPTLTLLPSPVPTQGTQRLVDLITVPGLQNLTLTLLCFTFVATSGLGILGLITSILYMRSRRGGNQPPEARR